MKINEHQEECLNILQEECAEVIMAASKIKRFGLYGRKDGDILNNLQNLEMEIGDVLALIDKCKLAIPDLTDEGVDAAKEAKMIRVLQWMTTHATIET